MIGAGDVAGAAGSGAAGVQRLVHGVQHDRVLAHTQVVVAAPDSDFVNFTSDGVVVLRLGEIACPAFQIGEDAVAAFTLQIVDLAPEEGFIIHGA